MLMLLHYSWEHYSPAQRVVITIANFFPASFRGKKTEFFEVIEAVSTFPIAHCIS